MSETDAPLIFVVDDDEALRRSAAFLFASVGLAAETFDTAAAFLSSYPVGYTGRPGCIVVDVRMPGMSGIELLRHLIDRHCDLPILIVTGHGDVSMAVGALKAGAYDFIEKPFREQHLLDMVEAAIRASRERLTASAARRGVEERLMKLSRREREVLDRVLQGKTNKIIAHELDLSIKTIEVYRSAVMAKMAVGSVAELVQTIASLHRRVG